MAKAGKAASVTGDSAGYELAYHEGVRALEHQERSLDELRSRAGTLLAAASLATSFLGAAALPKGAPWNWPVYLAVVAFAGSIVLCLIVLWPRKTWWFVNDPAKLIGDYVEDDPPASAAAMHRDLALHASTHHKDNTRKIDRLVWAFDGAAGLLFVQVLAWLIVLWGGTHP